MTLGVIGGSGIYDIEWLAHPRWEKIVGPFGKPSDDLLIGELDGIQLAFLPRHGRGHRIPPGEVNYRANIDALKRAGVTDVLAFSAVGSLRGELRSRLPLTAAAALGAGFVSAGGIGATIRLLFRRGRRR